MKKIRIVAVILCFVMVVTSLPCRGQAASKMKLNIKKTTLEVNQTTKLKIINKKGTVKWRSSNKAVATVSKNGKVNAVGEGKAIITATVKKKTLKAEITVKKNSGDEMSNLAPKPENELTEEERALYGRILGFESIPREGDMEVKCFIQNPFEEFLWFGREPQISVLMEDGTYAEMVREDICWTCDMVGIPKGTKHPFDFPLRAPLEKGKTYRILKLFNCSTVYLDFVIGETNEDFTYTSGILSSQNEKILDNQR